MPAIHHRFASVDGHRLFYREAGPVGAPAVVLLHGFPASSAMFRHAMPLLADRWHLIAPDHLGFGLSDAPSARDFDYSFDALTDLTAGLLRQLGVHRYAMYLHDYGAPIGWRLALRDATSVAAIVSQSGNAYQEGFQPEFFGTMWAYWAQQNPHTEAGVRRALTLEMTRWQYLAGVADETLVDPTAWITDHARLSRPGNDLVQLALFRDYASNPPLYPAVHQYFRDSQVPFLAIWGRDDPVFGPHGAAAFKVDLPNAEVHLIDGGHFLLETACDRAVELMRAFLIANL